MKTIVLMGAYPPPVGGNSVHIQRLHERLQQDGFSCHVVDIYNRPDVGVLPEDVVRFDGNRVFAVFKALVKLRRMRPEILHVHVSALKRFVLVWPWFALLLPAASRRVLTIHSGSLAKSPLLGRGWARLLASWCLRSFDRLVLVSEAQRVPLNRFGAVDARVVVIPAYIRSQVVQLDPVLAQNVNGDRAGGRRIVVVSGYGLALYGFEQAVQAALLLQKNETKVALYVCTYNTFDEDYLTEVIEQAGALQVFRLFRNLTPRQFSALLSQSDLYVRATDRDGDAVAIREAHGFCVPVVASDAVARPLFCSVYRHGDVHHLADRIEHALAQDRQDAAPRDEDHYPMIRQLYSGLS